MESKLNLNSIDNLYKYAHVQERSKFSCGTQNLGKLIYGIGPGISFNNGSQGITSGAGIDPIESGMRADGKFLPNNIKMSLQSGINNDEISHHLKIKNLFDPNKSSISGRYWKYNLPTIHNNKIKVQDDDPPEVLKPGKPDINSDENLGNLASFSSNENKSMNMKYNPIEKAHPSDGMGSLINILTEIAKKEIKKRSNISSTKNIPQSHHEQKTFQKEINMKELPLNSLNPISQNLPNSEIPVNSFTSRNKLPQFKNKLNLSEDSRSYRDSKINEDRRKLEFDRNQVMIDNDRVPININLSCNNLGGIPNPNQSQSYGFSGYGTPNLCNSYKNHQILKNQRMPSNYAGKRVILGQHQALHNPILGDHGYSTLQNYYDSMSAGNNVHKLARQWRNRDYYQYSFSNDFHDPIKFSKPTATKQNTIGQPFAPFMTQHQVNHPIYEDKAKSLFRNNQ